MIGQLNSLYDKQCDICGGYHAEDLTDFRDLTDISVYEQMARDLLANKGIKINANLHLQTAKKLNDAIQVNTILGEPSKLESYLKRNIYHFSAAKSYAQMEYYRDGMVDNKGNIKSFDTFKKWVADSGEMFNVNHLKTEYNMAHNSALIAEAWEHLDSELVEFTTAGDRKVRPSHAKLDKFTAPKDDPIWKKICPPLEWGCRCHIVPGNPNTPKKLNNTEAYNLVKAEVKGTVFENNPADTKVIFNNNHPYFQQANGKEKQLAWNQYGMDSVSKIKTRELDPFSNRESARQSTLNKPDESWLNPDKATTQHVKYYQDKAVIVTTGKDGEILSTNVLSIERENIINRHRKGVLIHRE